MHKTPTTKALTMTMTSENCPSTLTERKAMLKLQNNYSRTNGFCGYIANTTHTFMSYAVKLAAKFMTNPGKKHWEYVVYMVGFLKHSAGFKIVYIQGRNFDGIFRVLVMADSDLGGDREDGRSTMGIVAYVNESFCYGASKTIKAVVINTTHGECYSLTEEAQLGIWLARVMTGLRFRVQFPVPVLGDNEAAEQTASVPETTYARNVNLREHWIRSVMRFGDLTLAHIPSCRGYIHEGFIFSRFREARGSVAERHS